ncbi:MAG: universal stress protein [Pyrinomonadaceae bacterium]
MAGQVSRRLSNSFEGALAGGGDPATSPLYVFGPFLKLIVVAGVAQITFGATVWMVVLTVIMVSAMYRQVMTWVTDGSGGSGLSEEEFGGWAVKINGGITVIEYTLTFLVSMSALVTFVADRATEFGFPLNQSFLGIQYRTFLAIILTIFTGWLVNQGPKVAARTFGPATAAVLLLLWVMIFAAIIEFDGSKFPNLWNVAGVYLPDFNLQSFNWANIHVTFGGYARILALMTGIEIFANLVAAYDGKRAERSRKAFGSLIIIMGTTCMTMIVVGPAIYGLSDPTNEQISVFTQTMNALLPAWASYLGTLIGIAVLLSACAAASQGVQNLALGLRYRHYIAASLGQRNKYDVAGKPVWLMVGAICLLFLAFGTHEETYLALYAAGVFILLSMTGWAASKRLIRGLREGKSSAGKIASLVGTIIAALLTTGATIIIFEERFTEGAWIYFLLVPTLYMVFTYYRNRLGAPPQVEERLGAIISEKRYLPTILEETKGDTAEFKKLIVPLDGSSVAEQVLATARSFARSYDAEIKIVAIDNKNDDAEKQTNLDEYLEMVSGLIQADGLNASCQVRTGSKPSEEIANFAREENADLIVMSTRGKFEVGQILSGSVTQKVLELTSTPALLIRPTENWRSRRSRFKLVLVALDGSEAAEQVLPFIRSFADKFDSKVLLLSVPEGSESENYRATVEKYLNDIAESLREEGYDIITLVTGSGPARTILDISEEEKVDLIMLASHGRGGVERSEHIAIGSVAERVLQKTPCPVFFVPLRLRNGERHKVLVENSDIENKE